MSQKIKAVGYLKAPTDADVGRLAQAIRDCAKERGLELVSICVDKPARPGMGAAAAAQCLRMRPVGALISSTPEAARNIAPGLEFERLDASGLIVTDAALVARNAEEQKKLAEKSEAPPADETPAEGVDDVNG